ncbi:3-deoxy-7-phosphoheptulonate synthase [Streptomyces sp. HB132]|uniref:3-deoxy-7-phosphoheptulonate synthase n=1 Tax=Streptomyces sp. HB132 TaxID=767388 RepID=UPI0019603CFC|nr:3-deoxy-7-phosphoheptulonate synthase [Streptomyces sp. HB132]MBM7440072.1 3-deoxy-7-phosphoheptulonate synthase [Streptomyces sp. HB132]
MTNEPSDLPASEPRTTPLIGPGRVRTTLTGAAPLVLPSEVDDLSGLMAAAARGEAFVLQGSTCAEPFSGRRVAGLVRTLLQMSVVLSHAARMPVVKIARLASRHAGAGYGVAHANAAVTMNMIRAMSGEHGIADVRRVQDWNREFVRDTAGGSRFGAFSAEIDRGLRFMAAWGADDRPLRTTKVFASHEPLLLDHEVPHLLRESGRHEQQLWGLSAHQFRIGERALRPDDAHIELAELLANPICLTIGPATAPEEAVEYVRRLDPHVRPGRVTLISRMGGDRVRDVLPPIVEKVTASGHQVAWSCDPMHGSPHGPARDGTACSFSRVLEEIRGYIDVHRALGTHLGGLHFETSGARDMSDTEPVGGYGTECGPRLNGQQSVELAFLMAEMLRS